MIFQVDTVLYDYSSITAGSTSVSFMIVQSSACIYSYLAGHCTCMDTIYIVHSRNRWVCFTKPQIH